MADSDSLSTGENSGKPRRATTEAQRAILARGREELARRRAAGTLGRNRESPSESGGTPTVEPTDLERGRGEQPDPGNVGGRDSGAGDGRGGGWTRWFGRAEDPPKRKHRATQRAPLDLSGIESLLHSCFLVLSIRAGAHWEISPQEAKKLTDAVAKVARHYPIVASQKGADWGQLLLVCGTIGVPRAVQSWGEMTSPRAGAPTRPTRPSTRPPPPESTTPAQAARPTTTPMSNGGATAQVQTPSQLDPGSMAASHVTAS